MNRYVYVANNPINYVDLSGREANCFLVTIVAAAGGAAAGAAVGLITAPSIPVAAVGGAVTAGAAGLVGCQVSNLPEDLSSRGE